jgi:hypothetical protein
MLGPSFASSEKVSKLDFGRRSAGRQVGFVQDENTSIRAEMWRIVLLGGSR